MAKIWEPLTIETYQSWVDAIVSEASDDLTDWETTFIESIAARLYQKRNLSEGQAKALERIYAEKTR